MNKKEEKETEKKEKKEDQNENSIPKGKVFYKISSILDKRRKKFKIERKSRS